MHKKTTTQEYVGGKVYVGIDVHLRSYAVTVVFEGEVIKKWTQPACGLELVDNLRRRYRGCEISSAYEAGFSGFVLHRTLIEGGIKNIVVHASSVATSSGDRVKTDRRDSEKLARQLSAGMLTGIYVPDLKLEYRRQLSRTRQQLVKDRVRIMVQIRRRLFHFGYELCPGRVLCCQHVREFILKLDQRCELRICIQAHLNIWERLEEEIKALNKQLRIQASNCTLENLYRSVPGFGTVISRVLANELGDMSQFKSEKALFKYVGLTPIERSSGETIRRGHISRQGKPLLRKVLIEAAWVAIKVDSGLRQYYKKLSVRAGGKRAVVAVARKLIGRARAVLKKEEEYRMAA